MAGREALLHQAYLDSIGAQYAEITCVTASPASAGRRLGDIVAEKEARLSDAYPFWKPMRCPASLADLRVDATDPDVISGKADYAISALGSDIARQIEPALTRRGIHVFSNASAYRWAEDVPLLIPEVNHAHLDHASAQSTTGKLVCNPNCTTAGFVPLANALMEDGLVIDWMSVVTQQALSGKGDAIADPAYAENTTGNVWDDWTADGYNAEEWKSSHEPHKILGGIHTTEDSPPFPIHTHTTRVSTQYGHLEHVSIESFGQIIDVRDIGAQLAAYRIHPDVRDLPSTPEQLFTVIDRMPEPRRDVYAGDGMSVVIGDLRQLGPSGISMTTLSHNLRRGATWAGRQGLELYLARHDML